MSFRSLTVWFLVVLSVALVSRWRLEAAVDDRCRLDGNRIVPIYHVELMSGGDVLASFCCVRCAQEWPDVPPRAYWRVRDEVSGATLDASRASFIESSVITIPSRGDRTHVFRHWNDAMTHMAEYDGRRIPNPLVDDLDRTEIEPNR